MTDCWRFEPGRNLKSDPPTSNPAPDWILPFHLLDQAWLEDKAIAQTSGSTGEPKECAFQPQDVRASIRASEAHFQLKPREDGRPIQAWSALPMAGIGGRMMWWRSRTLGWTLTQMRPTSKPNVPAPLHGQDRYDFGVATPQQASALMDNGGLTRFKQMLLGGAPVPAHLESALTHAASSSGCIIHHGFGMTETLSHVAIRLLGQTSYTPLDGVEVSAFGADGALIIHAPSRGVHHLKTQDAIRFTSNSAPLEFEWLGRLDDVINTGGIKVHPAQLEHQLAHTLDGHLEGRRWYIAGRPHPETGQSVTLVVEGFREPRLSADWLDLIAQSHPGPQRPREVEWRKTFDETATGKVVRR